MANADELADTLTAAHDGLPAATDRLAAGTRLGRYEIVAFLGAGAMGKVYRARDTELRREVALKWIDPGSLPLELVRGRLRREAQAMARVEHPAVVRIYDVGSEDRHLYVTMELVSGGTLAGWLAQRRRSWREIVDVFIDVGRGLAAAHAAGLVHRDVKPGNILIDERGAARVSDFGVARTLDDAPAEGDGLPADAALTATGAVVGTPAYMAPEQLAGAAVDAHADQFAFCVTLWEALFGARPFRASGSGVELLTSQRSAIEAGRVERPDEPAVPRRLERIVRRGLAAEPARRWASLDELVAAMLAVRRGVRTRRIAIVGVTALAAVAAVVILRRPEDQTRPRREVERVLTTRGTVRVGRVSPDGREIAAADEAGLVVIPLFGDAIEKRLPYQLDQVSSLAWSPDGTELLVEDGNGIWLLDSDGTSARRVPIALGDERALLPGHEVVSTIRSGHELTFTSLDSGETRVCPIPGDSQSLRLPTVIGQQVLAVTRSSHLDYAVVRTDQGCASIQKLAEHVARFPQMFSPDGRSIWSIEESPDGYRVTTTWLDSDRVETRGFPGAQGAILGFRSDGALVTDHRTTGWRLLRMVPGEQPERLAAGSDVSTFVYAHHRDKVAVLASIEGRFPDLWVVSPARLLDRTAPLVRATNYLAWSPDDATIATKAVADDALQLVDVASGEVQRLILPDAHLATDIEWLDDRRVAYLSTDETSWRWIDRVDGSTGLVSMGVEGRVYSILRNPADGTLAANAASGTWYLPATGPAVRVSTAQASLDWSPDGGWLWLGHDGVFERWSRASGALEPMARLDLELLDINGEFNVMDDGSIVVVVFRTTSDLAVLEPAP